MTCPAWQAALSTVHDTQPQLVAPPPSQEWQVGLCRGRGQVLPQPSGRCSPDWRLPGFQSLGARGAVGAPVCLRTQQRAGRQSAEFGGAQHHPAPGGQSPRHQSAHASPRLTRKPQALRPRDDITPWTSSHCSVISTPAQRGGTRKPPSRVSGHPVRTPHLSRTPHSRTCASDQGATLLRTRGRRQRGFMCF